MSPAELYTKEERKTNGIFYTPKFLAQYLAKKILYYWEDTNRSSVESILDPACGDSMLLRSFLTEFTTLDNATTNLSIIGVDKDVNAVISSEQQFNFEHYSRFNRHFINTDGLFPSNEFSSINGWQSLRRQVGYENGVDIVLSNPPWGADMTEYDSNQLSTNFQLAKGQFDIYNLFIEVTLNNLREDGLYGFILPDSVFSQEQARLRLLLADTTTILLIARLGEKIFPEINRACVIVIGQKRRAAPEHVVNCFRLSPDFKKSVLTNKLTLEQVEQALAHEVPQKRFLENSGNVFDIDLRVSEHNIFDKIQSSGTVLSSVINNTRGAEISKNGLVCQCPDCSKWMPYPKSKNPKCNHCGTFVDLNQIVQEHIIHINQGLGNKALKVGEDLYRYTSRTKSWIDTDKDGINYKSLSIYNGDKILVRKTGIGITASIDYQNSIVNQVVYILKLKSEVSRNLTLEFVLAVLNSRAMTYYLLKKYGENEWKSHPYLTQTMLINLPFPKLNPNLSKHTSLIKEITEIIKSEVANSKEKNISKQSDLRIERAVAYFFKLNKKDYNTILETLNSTDPLIPIKRLLNCSSDEIFEVNGI
ncbi:N-6 DNA methylase [Pontibacter populi]|uniref:site-specific DNA-methyltransferase (adenine-specific) n=1 Tax=Pontibacter populi TaxID=890055 RepID=A0ABV1RXH6_9BACT